jgi:hypothetical protein
MASWFAAPPSPWFGDAADQLADSRALATAEAQPDTCDILRVLQVRRPPGVLGPEHEVVRAANVPCRVQPFDVLIAGTESGGTFGRSGDLVDTSAVGYQLFLPWGTQISTKDRVRLADGTKFEVNSVSDKATFGVEVVARLVLVGIDNPEGE